MGVTECTDLSPRFEQGLTFKVVFTQLSVCSFQFLRNYYYCILQVA